VLDNGVYTLTNLLRGRRGTEVFTGGHAAGDLFVLLDGVTRRGLPLDRVGGTLFHRLVGRGGELRDAPTHSGAFAGRDLKPYAPAQFAADGPITAADDLILTWVRRTRVGGELRDGTGEVPLAEDSEEYEIELMRASGAVARTATDLSSPTYTYTQADQEADLDVGDPVDRAQVYQNSAQVGRGFAAELELELDLGFFVGGEPDAAGSCGFDWAFTDFQTYAQRYTAGATGSVTSVSVHFNETDTPDVRVGIYADNAGLPDTLLAEGTGTASGAAGWHEIPLSSPIAVTDTDVFWVAVQVSAAIDSCAPSSVVNSGRQRNSSGHASGLAAPFGASSSFINTRGMRYTIEGAP
jgi:hypothetical protein